MTCVRSLTYQCSYNDFFVYAFQQMNMDTTPLEAGLDFFIKFDKVKLHSSCILLLEKKGDTIFSHCIYRGINVA